MKSSRQHDDDPMSGRRVKAGRYGICDGKGKVEFMYEAATGEWTSCNLSSETDQF